MNNCISNNFLVKNMSNLNIMYNKILFSTREHRAGKLVNTNLERLYELKTKTIESLKCIL